MDNLFRSHLEITRRRRICCLARQNNQKDLKDKEKQDTNEKMYVLR